MLLQTHSALPSFYANSVNSSVLQLKILKHKAELQPIVASFCTRPEKKTAPATHTTMEQSISLHLSLAHLYSADLPIKKSKNYFRYKLSAHPMSEHFLLMKSEAVIIKHSLRKYITIILPAHETKLSSSNRPARGQQPK